MEFLIPVRYSGVAYSRVQADTFDEAVEKARHEAEIKSSLELNLSETHFDILVPRLMLTDEMKKTWRYWQYWYTGTDGADWRVGYTNKGRESIPSFAESFEPIPANWVANWNEVDC